jgi:hypothetical protein
VSIVNAFNRGDIYSTDEKMIGQWIDGKPLYAKTINTGALSNAPNKKVAHSISNLGEIVSMLATYHRTDGKWFQISNVHLTTANKTLQLSITTTNVEIESNGGDYSDVDKSYVTLQYTKTTDSAISIGSETEYSTDEKVVGTWIDGKPIYQKTFEITSGISNDTAIELQNNCETLVGYRLNYADTPAWHVFLPEYVGRGVSSSKLENLLMVCPIIDYTTHKLTITPRIGTSVTTISKIVVTIQYTKSTT